MTAKKLNGVCCNLIAPTDWEIEEHYGGEMMTANNRNYPDRTLKIYHMSENSFSIVINDKVPAIVIPKDALMKLKCSK